MAACPSFVDAAAMINATTTTTTTSMTTIAARAGTTEPHPTYAALVAVQLILTIAFTVALRVFKRRFERTRVRRVTVVVLYMGGVVVAFTSGILLPFAVGLSAFPCWLSRLLTLCLFPFINTANLVRNSTFAVRTRWSRLARLFPSPGTTATTSTDGAGSLDVELQTRPRLWASLSYCLSSIFHVEYPHTPEESLRTFEALRFLYSRSGLWSFIAILFMPFFVAHVAYVFADPVAQAGCTGCFPLHDSAVPVILACEAGPAIILALVVASRLGRLADPWGFFSIEARTTAPLIAVAFAVQMVVAFGIPATDIDTAANVQIVAVASTVACIFAMTLLPFVIAKRRGEPDLQRAVYRTGAGPNASKFKSGTDSREERSSLTVPAGPGAAGATMSVSSTPTASQKRTSALMPPASASASTSMSTNTTPASSPRPSIVHDFRQAVPTLALLLASTDEELVSDFKSAVAAEWATESLTFLEDTFQWISKFTEVSPATRAARARKIVRLYVAHGAVSEINIDARMRSAVVEAVMGAKDAEAVPRSVFDEARQEVARILSNGAAARFLSKRRKSALPAS